jgi:hypothetical protein
MSDENLEPDDIYSVESPWPIHGPTLPAEGSPYCCIFSLRPATPVLDRFPGHQAVNLCVWVLAKSSKDAVERAQQIAEQLPCEIAGAWADVVFAETAATNRTFALQEQAARRNGFSVLFIAVPKPRSG